jgi:3-hydroxyisobutyrate dehydrogenase-like beta-hydroxyacid dehydrogenase
MSANDKPRLAIIGFGEAGQAIAAGLRDEGVTNIAAWDILFPLPEGARLREAADAADVRIAASAQDAVRDVDVVISAVTAASIYEAAQSVAPHLEGKPFYLDVNSVSPGRKRDTVKLFGPGVRYVDVAIVSPIHPLRHKSPLLIAGPHADAVAPALTGLGMVFTVAGAETGAAAAIKMVRSVMIKGIEALTLECFLAAQRAGVVEEVAASLKNNYPTLDWGKVAEYNIERMASHGGRRAAEMEEVADTLRELGVEPLMVNATVKRQRDMGALGKQDAIKATLDRGRTAMLQAISTVARDRH